MLQIIAFAAMAAQTNDPVVYSFAFFGCNRIETDDWIRTRKENPSSANVGQLKQSFADLETISPKPKFLFAVGDIVCNYAEDNGEVVREQLAGWNTLVNWNGDIPIVPTPGNHEVLSKKGKVRSQNPGAEAEWLKWFKATPAAKYAGNGPTPQNDPEDHLSSDQSMLSYTFDAGSVRFVMLNTDTFETDGSVAHIPSKWLAKTLVAADKDPKIKNVFVLGHRNVIEPLTVLGDSAIDKKEGAVMQAAMTASKKARAFLCAHVHAYDVATFGRRDMFQIVAGHGGSQLESLWHPVAGSSNGFAVIQIHQSGTVGAVGYHRPVPENRADYLKATIVPAKPDPEIIIYRPSVISR